MDQVPRTDFLFPKTNFMIGLGSIINLAGGYYTFNRSATADQADERALASDWAMVAEDIRGAMASVGAVDEEQMLLPLS